MAVIIVDERIELDRLISSTGARVERIIADGVEYGVFQELGTSRLAPQPFMSPAVEAVRPGFEAAFANQLTDAQVESVIIKTAFDIERGAKERAPVDTGALKNSIHVEEP
jgi:hypothetical protein